MNNPILTMKGFDMKRALFALLAATVLAGLAAIAFGAVTSCARKATSAATADPTPPANRPMPMPATASAAPPPSRQLHRRLVRVRIQNFKFLPARLVVSPGTRIVWTNTDSDPHTVTGDAPRLGLSSAALDTGGHYAAVVRRAGTITYHCTIHPYMHGSVLVQR